jgi:hypothetical protein
MTGTQRPVILVDDSASDLVFLRRKLDRAGVRNPVVIFVSSEERARVSASRNNDRRNASRSVSVRDVRGHQNAGRKWIRAFEVRADAGAKDAAGSNLVLTETRRRFARRQCPACGHPHARLARGRRPR